MNVIQVTQAIASAAAANRLRCLDRNPVAERRRVQVTRPAQRQAEAVAA